MFQIKPLHKKIELLDFFLRKGKINHDNFFLLPSFASLRTFQLHKSSIKV